ncbi:preprotein translocase subunit SecG [Desulfogranum japonicum]|uniref:preprotein translocase subunit SecG n=1 Tax=Desulfogranum japonicum TaxID=231447 RepID=UPI000416CDE7
MLLQHGKGADIGATFGGSSQSLFGAEGPVPLLNKITTLAAIVFMGTSVTLAYLSMNKSSSSVMKNVNVTVEQKAEPQEATPQVAQPVETEQPAEQASKQ